MTQQTILWTALPNGIAEDGNSVRVSVLMSPRLQPDNNPGQLSDFADFVDWPATLRQSRFNLRFGASAPVSIAGNSFVGPTRVDDRMGLADSSVWAALFPGTTPVVGFKWRDLTQHEVLSFPAADVDKLVRDLYVELTAATPHQLPTAATFISNPRWTSLINAVRQIDGRFSDPKKADGREKLGLRNTRRQFDFFRNHGFDVPPSASEEQKIFANLGRFQLFHTPPSRPKTGKYEEVKPDDPKALAEWQEYEQTKLPDRDEFQKITDFHRIVSAMNQYPTLLRKLGLVIDFLVARDSFAAAANAPLSVTVELPGNRSLPDTSPVTRALLDANRFQAVPQSPPADLRIKNGLLEIDKKVFTLLQSDVDGAAMKVMNFARTLADLRDTTDHQKDPVTQQPREVGAPALRNAGLMLVQLKRGDLLKSIVKRQDAFNQAAMKRQQALMQRPQPATLPPVPEMMAEDLIRGYRIDIWDDVSKRWHSLCQRQATYDLNDGAAVVNVPEEEGTVRLAATTSPDKQGNKDIIWLHEALISWAGWSLCAPPPGKTIRHRTRNDKGEIVHEDPVGEPEAEVPPGLRLKSSFKALPGSLPRLRYGRSYRLRARVVDLGGNSLDLQPKDFGLEEPPNAATRYFRYEPISSPPIALVKPTPGTTDKPQEGESMERVAIRSFNHKPSMNSIPALQRARRYAVPPRTSQREAEQHGVLDRGGAVDPTFFAMLATKDNSLAQEQVLTAGPLDGAAPVETGYAVLVDGDEIPYLPDPLAEKIAARIFDHPGFSSDSVITIPCYDGPKWPDALPFKIEIYEKPGDVPHYDAASRTLFIPLPKAARVTLRLSARPTPEALAVLGVWNWLSPAQQQQTVMVNGRPMTLEKLVSRGQHWMLTPWRNLELVHAVQRPLITPEFITLNPERPLGKTYAIPHFKSTCSIASTDRVDLRAAWNEPLDDPETNRLENVPRTDNAFSIKITDEKNFAGIHEYRLPADDVIQVNSEEPDPRDPPPASRRFQRQKPLKMHEFHDTRYRRIKYWLEATTKFREFMPASLLTEKVGGETKPTEDRIKVVGPEVTTWIESSMPPPAPEVLYVVPTFGWVRSADDTARRSWRRGGGLRVYLNRPWHVSGYGEMLAVVLPPANFAGDPNEPLRKDPPRQDLRTLKKFVTQWGNDPIWLSPFVAGSCPKPNNFPLARTARDPDGKWLPSFAPPDEWEQPPGLFKTTGRVPPETRDNPLFLDVVPHDVFYDEERELYYCDIEVNWGESYYPFIRLALARYQPVSQNGAHMSTVVLADFMPLIPDRWLNVSHTNDSRTRRVRVFGNTYESSSSHLEAHKSNFGLAASSVIEVWVEKLDPKLGEDFGWHREIAAIVRRDNGGGNPRLRPIASARVRANDLLRHREYAALIDENMLERVFITPPMWHGNVTLPAKAGDSARYRLVIAEYEEYIVDGARPYEHVTEKGRRLVFVEHVELD